MKEVKKQKAGAGPLPPPKTSSERDYTGLLVILGLVGLAIKKKG